MRPPAVCVWVQGMCGPYQIGHCHFRHAYIQNGGGLPHKLRKRPRSPFVVNQSHAGACGRLPCASQTSACLDSIRPLAAASVPTRSYMARRCRARRSNEPGPSFRCYTSARHRMRHHAICVGVRSMCGL